MSDEGYDRHITVFSPEGRLYQVEYALKAIQSFGATSVAVRGRDCVVIAAHKKILEKLVDPISVTSLFPITREIGCVASGIVADCRAQVFKARDISHKFAYKMGYPIPSDFLAKKISKVNQVYTQHAAMRPLGVSMILASYDCEKGPLLYKCDPSGYYVGYKATSMGIKGYEINSDLENRLKKTDFDTLDSNGTIEVVLSCMGSVLSSIKSREIEVAMVDKAGFKRLGAEEIDDYLNCIFERD